MIIMTRLTLIKVSYTNTLYRMHRITQPPFKYKHANKAQINKHT